MENFEDVRVHIAGKHSLRENQPYVLSFDIALSNGRKQGVYLADLDTEDGKRYLRISTPVSPMGQTDATRCLRFNWEQRVGYFALGDLDGTPYLHLCENRPYEGLNATELESVTNEIGVLADRLEQLMGEKDAA